MNSNIISEGVIALLQGRGTYYVNHGNIPVTETVINAVAGMANDWERRLLGMHCGQFLPRDRHKAWAAERIVGAKYITDPSMPNSGVVVFAPTTGEMT